MSNQFAEDVDFLRASGQFDPNWYLKEYPDVASLGMDPLEHYVRVGTFLHRKPTAGFDTGFYLSRYRDVATSGANPFAHYLRYGAREGRVPVPEPSAMPAKAGKQPGKVRILPSARSGAALVPKPVPQGLWRKLAWWDWATECTFKEALLRVQRANRGYFERTPLSIVMPTRNRAASIGAAIGSVLAQTFSNWELFVIDDGSTDQTSDVVKSFAYDRRIRYVATAPRGVAGARNVGLDAARGDFVFYLDSDNTWHEDFLKLMVVFMTLGDLRAAYCGSQIVDDSGEVVAYRGVDFDWAGCHQQNYVDMNGFAHRRSAAAGHRFDQSLRRLVDWDFILRITADQRASFAPFCGVVYYDGTRGARITLTEYQGAEIKAVETRIRDKHDSRTFERHARVELRPTWRDVVAADASAVIDDAQSAPLLQMSQTLIDWTALRSRQRYRDLVSIVVLCYNNAAMTKACIESVLQEGGGQYAIEVIAVNNGSSDDTADVLSALAASDARVRPVTSPANLMFSLGNNFGAAHASGEYGVLLNNDTLAKPGWLEPLIDSLRLDPTVGLVGPKLLFPDGTLQCGGLVFGAKSKIPYHLYKGRAAGEPGVNKSRAFQALTGACLAFRTDDFLRLSGLDPCYVNGCEDLDLCFRMRETLGKRVLYNPRSEIVHLESKSQGRGRFIARNREKFIARWGAAIETDDAAFYREDGFVVGEYVKTGAEPDGPAALYAPVLQAGATSATTARPGPYNVGFSTMWYERGISFQTDQVAQSLEGEQFQTHIFARWESHRFSNSGAIRHPRVHDAGDDPSADEILKWATDRKIDLMIFMEVHPKDWKRARALRQIGVQVVCYENLDVLRHEHRRDYGLFDLFLFHAFHTRQVLLAQFPQARSLMLPWGVPPREERARAHADPREAMRFVHVAGWGGLNNRKNTDLLIRVFARCELPGAELHVFTQSPLAQYGEEVCALVKTVKNIIVHEGTVDDIDAAYRGKTMLLWPSKREGLGLPILEALGHGLPVLISDGYLMKQWIVPGEHGIVCPARPAFGDMLLPEMEIDEDRLGDLLTALVADPDGMMQMRRCVERDQAFWQWRWQAQVLRTEIARCIDNPSYRPADDLSYVPPEVLEFEYRRRRRQPDPA